MFQEPRESNNRLIEAATALREANLRGDTQTDCEEAILRRLKPSRQPLYRGLVLAVGLGATAIGGVILFAPTKSYAAELRRIAKNGDIGMRHVRNWTVQSDGSKKLEGEYYVNGLIGRFIYEGGQLWFGNGILKNLHSDGAVDICRRNGEAAMWMNDSAKQILAINSTDPKSRVSLDHGIDWHGRVVDRFTIDGDIVDGRKQALHMHTELYADPKSEQPLEMDGSVTGMPPSITEWDYADFDPKLLDLQGVDPTRVYNSDDEQEAIKASLTSHGRKVTVGGQTVELLQLWIDETGHAAAIVQADFSRPDNFGIRINGDGQDPEPNGEPFSGRYLIHKPTPYKGRPIQVIFNFRENPAPRVSSPDEVTVEIPVFDDKSLLGYVRFDNVQVHRAWDVHYLLEPMNLPFWSVPLRPGSGAATVKAD